MSRPSPIPLACVLLAASACSDPPAGGTGTTTSATGGSTTIGEVWTTGEADTDATEPVCSVMSNDCPSQSKCTVIPTADDEVEHACVPILGDDRPGELCEEVSNEPGHDSCLAGAVCVGVDAETKRCVAFCDADETCPEEEDTTCVRTLPSDPLGEGLPLCLRECNPLKAPCADGWACHEDSGAKRWFCAPRLGGQYGEYGSPCDPLQLGLCAPGFACLAGYVVSSPECSDSPSPSLGCCAKLCPVGGAALCPGEGEECLPFYPEAPPPGFANLGVCALPQAD